MYWMVITAFKTDLQITTRTSLLWPTPWTSDQFFTLLADNPFGTWFRNTLVVSVVSMVVGIVGDIVPWGQLSAASILISVPVVAAYAYAQKFLVEGLSVGAVKG